VILRLYLDEDLMPSAARQLREQGYDVWSSRDAGADGEDDNQQFERARADGRAIVDV
jgi:predicted nuclease of predicted toxin-antitoxin system